MGSKAEDLDGTGELCCGGQSCVMRVVSVENRGAAGLKPQKDLCLRIGNCFERRKESEMRRLHSRDHRDMRAYEPRQVGDLSRMVHAEFEYAVMYIRRQ